MAWSKDMIIVEQREKEGVIPPYTSASRHDKTFPLPSIYSTTIPKLPPMILQNSSGETMARHQLAQFYENGPTRHILKQTYSIQAAVERYDRLNEISVNNKVGEGREEDSSIAVDDTFGKIPKRRKLDERGRRKLELRSIPQFTVPEVEIPRYYPTSGMIERLHRRASTNFESNGQLFPRLTDDEPRMSERDLQKLDEINAALATIDDIKAKDSSLHSRHKGTHKQGFSWDVWQKQIWNPNSLIEARGERQSCWRDVGEKFEGSALVALGMLGHLLALHISGEDLSLESEVESRPEDETLVKGKERQRKPGV